MKRHFAFPYETEQEKHIRIWRGPVMNMVKELLECEDMSALLDARLQEMPEPVMQLFFTRIDHMIHHVSPHNSLQYHSDSMLQQASFPMW
jgi:hypothetical protein